MNISNLVGSIPALITPFVGGHVDFDALQQLVEWHIKEGSSALVIGGTTGESATLQRQELGEMVAVAVQAAAGRIPIIGGTSSNCTAEAIARTEVVEKAGAQATLHATGFYNRPSAEQVIAHYEALSSAAITPIIMYDIPGRTGLSLNVESVVDIANIPGIGGIKDSTGNLGRLTEQRINIGKPFVFLSGDDFSVPGYLAHGGSGVISVTANVVPGLMARLCTAALGGNFQAARELHETLLPLHQALMASPSPAPSKYALSRLGLCHEELRMPMSCAPEKVRQQVDETIKKLGLTQ
ncbi:4-hydroxy-tetrahydrodipicolinate synthase [Aeromonas veronii]|uniref:4-hydroxy-tetrahydrodipicolinate synthase n=1 Tax=Aeromonas veronii TaxID=654 RepID=UPI001934803F|nr:4-hydroxy-tetrahydrodipicolinate synthase [Aeromonas veronii]MBM0419439.1 4-hydroxy-tetrahydrodipicolinate synthase [Aeromonas veronii]MBW3791230.1 4-hydroxy-tetrahydrodipicolinate synthase [Aeromonas veronii]